MKIQDIQRGRIARRLVHEKRAEVVAATRIQAMVLGVCVSVYKCV